MDRDALVLFATGTIVLLTGVIMFLAFNPTYIYFSYRAAWGVGTLTYAEFQFYHLLDKILMPILHVLIAVGIAMLLLSVFTAVVKKQKS